MFTLICSGAQAFLIVAFLYGLYEPLFLAYYAVALIPFQVDSFVPGLKINQLGIVIWLVMALLLIIRNKKVVIQKNIAKYLVALGALLLSTLVSYAVLSNVASIEEYFRLLVALLFPISILLAFPHLNVFELTLNIFKSWAISATIVSFTSLINILQNGGSFLSYFDTVSSNVNAYYDLKFASSPFFEDPNNYAGFLIFSIAITFFLMRNYKKFFLVPLFIELLALFTSFSRGGYIAFVLGIIIILVIQSKNKWFTLLLVSVGIGIGSFYVVQFIKTDWSAMSRFSIWKTAIRMFMRHPIFGVGLQNFTYLFFDYDLNGGWNPYTHNIFLKVLVETGIVGELFFLYVCIHCIRNKIRELTVCKGFCFTFLFCIISFLIQGMSVEFFSSNYFWMIIILGEAITAAISNNKANTDRNTLCDDFNRQ